MALTDTSIRKVKPSDKPFKMTDSSGLYLFIEPNGSKLLNMVVGEVQTCLRYLNSPDERNSARIDMLSMSGGHDAGKYESIQDGG